MTLRENAEARFESLGRFVVRRPWVVIALVLLFAVSLSSQAPRIRLDTSVESFLRDDNPAKLSYDAFRDQFGRGEILVAAIRSPDVLAPAFLSKLEEFHRALEDDLPHLEEVRSLINARVTRSGDDELIVDDLLEEWPQTPAAWSDLRSYTLANPLYENLLVSKDAGLAVVSIEGSAYPNEDSVLDLSDAAFDDPGTPSSPPSFITGAENEELVTATRSVVERFEAEDFSIDLFGSPAMQSDIASAIQTNMARFVALMILIVLVLLYLFFRRISGVILPLVVTVPAVSGTIGSMAITGQVLSAPTQILPSLLLAVGIGAAVHILAIFFQNFDAGESREDAIAHALGHSGLPVCMTSLTTAGGLLSFVSAELEPVMLIGIFAPLGIGLSLIYTLLLLPALLAVIPLRTRSPERDEPGQAPPRDRLGDLLVAVGDFSIRHARVIVVGVALVSLVSLLGASKIRFGHDILAWFPDSHPVRMATLLFDDEMQGSMQLEIIVDAGVENGIQSPQVLNALEAAQEELAAAGPGLKIPLGKTISVTDVVKEINQALGDGGQADYRIPENRQLVAQELLLFENSGSDDLEKLVDSQFSMARVSLRLPYIDPIDYVPYIARAVEIFEEKLGPGVEVWSTGFLAVMGSTIDAVIRSMTRSYVLAVLIITPLMILLIGSLRMGLVSMIPNLVPILITLGIMGWAGIIIDAFTLMIGGIAL
ncbi:MAG: MMPL family transporter, partial [Myxococcota bacterium]|nr:MMPL family transporter [Myxococcota bacterium]